MRNTSTSRFFLTAGFAIGVLQAFYGLIKGNEDLDVSKRIKHKQKLNKTPSPLTVMHTSLPFSETYFPREHRVHSATINIKKKQSYFSTDAYVGYITESLPCKSEKSFL